MTLQKIKLPGDGTERRALMVAYALWRSTGMTQTQAAELAGSKPRTARRWEKQEWWHEVEHEAAAKFVGGIVDKARRKLEELVEAGDGPSIRYVLDRLDPFFVQRSVRAKVRDRDGNEREVIATNTGPSTEVVLYLPENGRPDLTPEQVQEALATGSRALGNGKRNGKGGTDGSGD